MWKMKHKKWSLKTLRYSYNILFIPLFDSLGAAPCWAPEKIWKKTGREGWKGKNEQNVITCIYNRDVNLILSSALLDAFCDIVVVVYLS